MSGNLPQRRHGTHLPPQAYRRTQTPSSSPPQGTSSWFEEAATPADPPQLPESEWPTEDIDATAAIAATQILPAVPADADTQIIPAVSDQPPQENPTPPVAAEDGTLVLSVLSDPWDIAFRDRLLTNLHRISGFGKR